ncbi:MAG: formate dehydrogenase accessory sulfurtransferase FdhD [Hyphomicrobium sp.]
MQEALIQARSLKVSPRGADPSSRIIPEETPVAFVYDGTTHAVMMATPADLEDFAIGFSLSEGKVENASEIAELSVVEQDNGIEVRMWLVSQAGRRVAVRRRALLGPTGCGLCGVESLDAALPQLRKVTATPVFEAGDVAAAVASVMPAQVLNHQARALHAAGFWTPEAGLVALMEDVGRHNALDKLAGALTRLCIDPASGIVVITSRVSVEMIQKAANCGAPVVAAVSAPTGLALRSAVAAGITLVGIARPDSYEIFTHPYRIVAMPAKDGGILRDTELHAAC